MAATDPTDTASIAATIAGAIDAVAAVAARTAFSGVVRLDGPGGTSVARAFGAADRRHGVANTVDTRFGLASGTKGLTALAILALVERGTLSLATPARSLLGADLPLVDDAVTVEHLLAHRSGVGDYLDESVAGPVTDHLLDVPLHGLTGPEAYLPLLDGRPQAFAPGTGFAYNNGGFVLLALLAERAAGVPFASLVHELVCAPAGMERTAFLRSDELPGDAAVGYLEADGLRTNVLHLPVTGCGDGGVYAPVGDVHALWAALFAGRIVMPSTVAAMVTPRSATPSGASRYGLGLWLAARTDAVQLEGYDAGVSFRSVHRPSTGRTYTVVANWTDGAWPLCNHLDEAFLPDT